MTPEQFYLQIQKGDPPPVSLFLGPELYQRDACRRLLLEKHLPAEEREGGFIRHDMETITLAAVIDDARSLSLFAPRRLIWVTSAEEAGESGGNELAAYVRDPTPGVVLVFDSRKPGFENEDKAKLERLKKFYGVVSTQVEFRPMNSSAVQRLAQKLAREAGLSIAQAELDLLLEAVGEDASRVALEIEKLRLYKGPGARVTATDIAGLVPNGPAANIFELVSALGRGNRAEALSVLDTLVKEGEYLPLVLTFLSTQFRQALAAREQGLRSAGQIQAYFTKAGVPMWSSRAEQIQQTISRFSQERLAYGVSRVFSADRALRDARPDDRIIMEEFVLDVTRP